jgi:hypothetical protein
MRRVKQIVIALITGVVFQGLIFLAAELHLSISDYLMLPGLYALSPVFPEGMLGGNGVALFGIYLIMVNALCYALFSYLFILLIGYRQ